MSIPYVIDNQTARLADVLRELLAGHEGRALDIATAYFSISGFAQLRDRITQLGSFTMPRYRSLRTVTVRSRLVWIADLLPDALAGEIRAMIDQAAAIMKPTLERG